MTDDELAVLWGRFKDQDSKTDRDRLIVHYSPLVKFVAGRVSAGLPSSVDRADLVSYGVFGLIDAIDKFDLGRGFKFETYAISRIRGNILDELRSVDWVPRSVRTKARALDKAFSDLESGLGRSPSEAEVASELGVSDDQYRVLLGQTASTGMVALDEVFVGDDGGDWSGSLGEMLPDTGPTPGESYGVDEMRRVLATALGRLPEREKVVLTLYYLEGLTLAEVGAVLGVTESRVCQIHTKAVSQNRAFIAASVREPV